MSLKWTRIWGRSARCHENTEQQTIEGVEDSYEHDASEFSWPITLQHGNSVTLLVPFDQKGIKDSLLMSVQVVTYEPNKKCLHISPFQMGRRNT